MNKIVIYGVLPPPTGGVSIHLKRFIEYLKKNNIDFEFYPANSVSLKKLLKSQMNFKKRIIHIHSSLNWKFQLSLLLLKCLFKKDIIVTIHNDRFINDYNLLSTFKKICAKFFFKRINKIISVNPDTDFGFVPKAKIETIPAYLEPLDSEIHANLPNEIIDFRKNFRFLITSNASRIVFHNNQDLYGIDLSIDLMKLLLDKGYNKVGFLYVIPRINDYEYFKRLKKKVRTYNLLKNFLLYTKTIGYASILNISDIYVRPTNTDGDSVSVREALHLNVPTVASDIVTRPKGTIIFKNRNIEDFYIIIEDIINNYNEYKKLIKNIKFENSAEKILKIYGQLG